MAILLGRLARRLTQGPQRADAASSTALPDAPVPDAVPALPPVPLPAVSADAALPDALSAAALSAMPIPEPDPQALLPAVIPAPSGPRVFISHSTLDNAFGLRLAADLRQALGAEEDSVWFDASGGLQGGDVWLDQIAAELSSHDVFLLILSPAALTSAWVQDELRMAWNQRNSASGKVISRCSTSRAPCQSTWRPSSTSPSCRHARTRRRLPKCSPRCGRARRVRCLWSGRPPLSSARPTMLPSCRPQSVLSVVQTTSPGCSGGCVRVKPAPSRRCGGWAASARPRWQG